MTGILILAIMSSSAIGERNFFKLVNVTLFKIGWPLLYFIKNVRPVRICNYKFGIFHVQTFHNAGLIFPCCCCCHGNNLSRGEYRGKCS